MSQVKTAMLAGVLSFKQADKMNYEACVAIAAKTKASSVIRLFKINRKIIKLLQFEKF